MRNVFFVPFFLSSALMVSSCYSDETDMGKMLIAVDEGALYPGGWSDDGAFVFATLHRGDSWQIAQISAENGQYALVDVGLEGAGVGDAQGGKLLIESVEDGGSDIYVFDLEKKTLSQVTDTERYEWHPTFRPDGTAVVYDIQTKTGPDIYQQDLSDGTLSVITDNLASEQAAQFSPSGQHIAFHRRVGGEDDNNYDMIMRDLRSGTERAFANTEKDDSYPNWNPEGDQLVFSSNQNGEYDLFITCTNGNSVHQLTRDAGNEKYPKWSPDGQSILYQSDQGDKKALYLIDAPKALTCD